MDGYCRARLYRHEPLHQSRLNAIRLFQRRAGLLAHAGLHPVLRHHGQSARQHVFHAVLENPSQPQRHRHACHDVHILFRHASAAGNRRHAQLHILHLAGHFFIFHFKRTNYTLYPSHFGYGLYRRYPVTQPIFQGGQEFAALVSLAGGAMSGWAYLQVRELSLLGEPGWRVVFYLSLTGLIMGAVWSTITGWHPLTVSSLPYLAGIGISAMIAQLAMTRAYKVGKKFTVASLSYLTVVFSALSGVLLFGDKITWQEAAGMVIIVAGGVFSSFTPASIKKFLMKQ